MAEWSGTLAGGGLRQRRIGMERNHDGGKLHHADHRPANDQEAAFGFVDKFVNPVTLKENKFEFGPLREVGFLKFTWASSSPWCRRWTVGETRGGHRYHHRATVLLGEWTPLRHAGQCADVFEFPDRRLRVAALVARKPGPRKRAVASRDRQPVSNGRSFWIWDCSSSTRMPGNMWSRCRWARVFFGAVSYIGNGPEFHGQEYCGISRGEMPQLSSVTSSSTRCRSRSRYFAIVSWLFLH